MLRGAVQAIVLAVLASSVIWRFALPIPNAVQAMHSPSQFDAGAKTSEVRPSQPSTPVVVELFTSEGCSDCPPADRLLNTLEQTQPVPGVEIIPLEQHVDYWNHEGWRDPFSSSQFTSRQKDYVYAFNLPTAYTPEMIVDGSVEFVGSDSHRALVAIARASLVPKANLRIEQLSRAASAAGSLPLHVNLASSGASTPTHSEDVLLAVTEDYLASNVTRGENAGVRMNHFGVVRELRLLGHADSTGSFSAAPELALASNWKPENLHVVAFVQDRSSKRIRAASTLSLSASGLRDP